MRFDFMTIQFHFGSVQVFQHSHMEKSSHEILMQFQLNEIYIP